MAKLAAQPACFRCSLGVVPRPRPRLRRLYHLLLQTFGGLCPSIRDHRIEFVMMQQTHDTGITLTQYSPWVWHVWLDGKRMGTVSGDRVAGFTARDMQHDSIGRGYACVEAAVEAWVPVIDTHP
jgi:hypothetical protein